MLLDKEQLVSLVLLVGCVGLLVCTRFNVPRNALIYSTLVALFLLFSLLFTLLRGREFSLELLLGPIGNVIIVCAVSAGVLWLGRSGAQYAVNRISILACIAAVSVLLSPWIYPWYINPPPDSGRLAGVFANPNEAAMVCGIGVALCIDRYSNEGRSLWLLCALICAAGALATFSKAGMAGLLVVVGAAFARGALARRGATFVVLAGIALAASVAFLGWGLDDLDPRQLKRVEGFLNLARFSVDENTSSNRNFVWQAAIEQIGHNWLILGGGLGSMREIVGGLFEDGSWRGAHNFWLVLLGEAGIVVLALFASFGIWIAGKILRANFMRVGLLGIFLVFLVDTFSSHNILELRFYALFIGVVLGALRIDEVELKRVSASAAGVAS